MPINARNIIVKAHQKPTRSVAAPSVDGPSTLDSIKKEAKEKLVKETVEVVAPKEQKYLYKEDGVLVRHINTKSLYMRDMHDFET